MPNVQALPAGVTLRAVRVELAKGRQQMAGTAPGEPPINFHVHRARQNEAGAREEFEQLVALLVQAVEGRAHLVHAGSGGDWGIDALVGDLSGQVEIWQAKYYIDGFKDHHRDKITRSFQMALRRAGEKGYEVRRWVLCIPCNLEPETKQWWDGWQAERERPELRIELWDANQLRSRLLAPAAAHVRVAFYGAPQPELEEERPRPAPAPVPPDRRWRGGNEILAGDASYLLHDGALERPATDHAWVWREAAADRIEPDHIRVWLRQVQVLRPSPAGAQAREALRIQARMLRDAKTAHGMPGLVGLLEAPECTTLAAAMPAGRTWRDAFGPAAVAPDRLTAASALSAAADLGAALGRLHRSGHAHRALSPDGVFLTNRTCRAVLRDLGLVGLSPRAGEVTAPYQAPEQGLAPGRKAQPGPHTDTYQLAALLYHTLTGHPPSPVMTPPIRASMADLPAALDEVLSQALDPDPGRRPALAALVAELRASRRQLARAGVQ